MFRAETLPASFHVFALECPRERNESQADYFERFADWISAKVELIQIRQIETAIIAALEDLREDVRDQPTTVSNIMSRVTFEEVARRAIERHRAILEDTEKAIAADGG